jgi:hypothetical protein
MRARDAFVTWEFPKKIRENAVPAKAERPLIVEF